MKCHFIAEGVVVRAPTGQSTLSFDKSQKQRLKCVCPHKHTQQQQQQGSYCYALCGTVGWHVGGKWGL